MDNPSWTSVLPALAVLAFALLTRKTVEALLFGSVLGFVMLSGPNFFDPLVTAMLKVMRDETVGWIILVCGLFGSLIRLLIRSGGAQAFGDWLGTRIHGPRSALFSTWLLGLVIFIDDYLNALTVGSSMKRITDRFKISREMLAYVVDSTAAPICVLVPLSTWAIFVSSLMENNGAAAEGQGFSAYIGVVPFILYAWVAVILVLLVALKIVPVFGPMRQAERDAQAGVPPKELPLASAFEARNENLPAKRHLIDFILPLVVLIGATWLLGKDALKGVIVALAATALLCLIRRSMSFNDFSKSLFEGFQTMVPPLAVVVMSFVLKEVNDELHLTDFVIATVKPWMSAAFLPAVAFLSLSAITFATGSFWGVYAVTLPIIIPLADQMGSNQALAIGAVISAGAFGSHACVYGDSTVLSSTASGCDNVRHALTQLPFAVAAATITTLGYIVLGWSLA